MKTLLAAVVVLGNVRFVLADPGAEALYRSEDVARPVPGETSLAGSVRPDITRFPNSRAVRRPSLSPDGRGFYLVTESDQFVHAVRQHGGDVQYVRFPDEGHGIEKLSNRIIAYRRIAAFLEEKLHPTGEKAQTD